MSVASSVSPFNTDLTVDTFDAVLQYTMYAMMIPFFIIGGDHRADSWLGEPGTVDTEKFNGDDGTVNERLPIQFMHKLIRIFLIEKNPHWIVVNKKKKNNHHLL